MLSVLVLETRLSELNTTSKILATGQKQRTFPIKRLKTVCSIDEFTAEIEDNDIYNTVVMSLESVQDAHVDLARRLRAKWRVLFVVFVLGDPADVEAVTGPSIQVSKILYLPP